MKMKQNDKAVRKKLYAASGLILAAAYALCCFVISPMYFRVSSDISYAETVTPVLIQYWGIITELVAISVFYGIMIYGIYRFGASAFRFGIAIFAIVTTFKYSANTAMTWITYNNAIPSSWQWDIANVAFYTVLELLQLIIIMGISKRIISKCEGEYLPLGNLTYRASNPIMKSALVCGVVTFAAKAVGRALEDGLIIATSGLPENAVTVVLMALSYASLAVMGVICYFVVLLTTNKIYDIVKNADA